MAAPNVPVPDPPDADGDVPDPEMEGVAGDRMKMVGGGLAALGMVYGGLSSFDQFGELFGSYGRAAAEPMQAIRDFVQEGKRRYMQQGGSTAAKMRGVLLSEAEDPDLDERVNRIAEKYRDQEQRIRQMSREFASQQVNSGVRQMAEDVASEAGTAAQQRNALSGPIYRDLLQNRDDRYRRLNIGQVSRRTGSRTQQEAEAVMRALQLEEERLETSAQERADMDLADEMDFQREQSLNRAQSLTRHNEEFDYGLSVGSRKEPPDQPRGFRRRAAAADDLAGDLHTDAQQSPGSMSRDVTRGGRSPGKISIDPETDPYMRRAERLSAGEHENVLRRAYRQYQAQHMLEQMPQGLSYEELNMQQRFDPSFKRAVQQEMDRELGRGTEDSGAPLPSDVMVDENGREVPITQAANGPTMGSPRYADAAASRAMRQADITAISGELPGGTDAEDILYHNRGFEGEITEESVNRMGSKAGLVDRLALRAKKKFDWAMQEMNEHMDRTGRAGDSPEFDFTLNKVQVDESHHVFRGTLTRGEQTVGTLKVPVVSNRGTYRRQGQQRSVIHPFTKLLENDLYQDQGAFQEIIQARSDYVARPDELSFASIDNYIDKFLNDLRGGRTHGALDFLQKQVDTQFDSKSFASSSVQDNLRKAMEGMSAAEQMFTEIKENPTRADNYRQGLDSMQNMRMLYNTGDRYFASDSEFISPEMMGEAGVSGRSKTPFEIAGAVVSPEKDASMASIRYKADLSGASEDGKSTTEQEVKRIYQQISEKSEEEANRRLKTMQEGGELSVTVDGQTFDLLEGKPDDIKALSWVPDKESGEELGSYYMRVQNAMLDKYGANFSVGQNFMDSENTVFSKMSSETGVDMHRALKAGQTIDTMNMAHVLSANPNTSKSLSSITAAAFGMEGGTQELQGALDQFQNRMDLEEKARKTDDPDMADAIRGRLQRDRDNLMPKGTDAQQKFLKRLDSVRQEMPADMSLHTAEFDAFMTGRVALPELKQSFIDSPAGSIAEKRARSALSKAGQFAGDREFMERHGEMPYGGMQDDEQGGFNPFFTGQDAATMGRGVLMHARTLPFARLQNPVRQLYQRTKPKKLTGRRGAVGTEQVEYSEGASLPRRARLPDQDTQQALRYEDRMKNFRNPSPQGATPPEQPKDYRTGIAGRVESVRPVGGDDHLRRSREQPMLFAGAGTATPQGRGVYGKYADEIQFGVTSKVAYLPHDHANIYESRGQSTAARREAMMPEPSTKTQKTNVDLGQVAESEEGRRKMDDWIKTTAEKMGIDAPESPTEAHRRSKLRDVMEETYMLSKIREDADSGLTDKGKQLLDDAIEERYKRMKGRGESKSDKASKLLRESAQGDDTRQIGGKSSLFNPREGGIVKDPLLTSSHKRLLGLDLTIQRNESKPDQLTLQYIEEPPDTFKEMTSGAKVGVFGSRTAQSIGMAGEQAIMEAASMKSKRRDYAGYMRMQVERLYGRAVDELQDLASRGDGQSLTERNKVLDRFAGALEKMSGGRMSAHEIRNDVIRETMGGKKFADYFEMDYTDKFTRALEDGASTTSMMAASKDMGVSMRKVFQEGSEMLRQFDPQIDKKEADRKVAKRMRSQVTNLLEKMRTIESDDVMEERGLVSELDKTPNGPKGESNRRQIETAIGELKKQKQALDKLYDGKIEDLSDTAAADSGSLWDMFVDAETGNVSMAFRALAPSQNMQESTIGGSNLGGDFESRVGRATRRKRSSMLTSALVSHSASQTIGALGGKEQMAAEAFQAWISSKSGAAAFSDQKFAREVFQALSQSPVNAKDWFDPDKIVSDNKGNLYYEQEIDRVPLADYVQQHFQWDEENGELKFIGGGHNQVLDVSPFGTLNGIERAKTSVVGMVTGNLQTEGGTGKGKPSTLTVVFGEETTNLDEGRINARDFHNIFGKQARAQQYHQHENLEPPRPNEERAYPDRSVYFGKDAKPLATGGDTPAMSYKETIFNENFDFLEVRLHGGLEGQQAQQLVDALKKSGVSEELINKSVLGDGIIKNALMKGDDDPKVRQQVEQMVDYLRGSKKSSPTASMFVPTKTGGNRPQTTELSGGVTKANIGQWADLADKLDPNAADSINKLQSAVNRIHRKAQNIERRYGSLTDRKAQQELRRAFEGEFTDSVESGAFIDAEQFFSQTLRKGADTLRKNMEEMQGTYLGGEYKLSRPQNDFIDKFGRLADHVKANRTGQQFKEEVAGMLENAKPHLAADNADEFDRIVNQASQDLESYIRTQLDETGGDISQWRGMGVGEGFMARSKAEQVKQGLSVSHQAYENNANPVSEATNLYNRTKENFEGSPSQEVAIAEQEIKRPGSTPGLMMMSVRQPDFTASGGYEMSRMSVMGDEALRALGQDPEHVHAVSNPLISWSRKEDYDYDMNYMAAVDDSAVSHMMRQTRGQTMPEHMANLAQIMNDVAGDDFSGEVPGAGKFESHVDEVQLDDGTTIRANRVTTQVSGDQVFKDTVAHMFGAPGLAAKAAASGQEARDAYALQQSIVGQFGAYAKQGALKTRQRQSAFTDLMTRAIEERKNMTEAFMQQADLSEETAQAKADAAFRSMFSKSSNPILGTKKGDGWTHMKKTFALMDEKGRQGAGVGDMLHRAALAETEITQAIAIEKYKKGDAQATARRMNNIMQTLHGNPSGSFDNFDQAFDQMMKEDLPFNPAQMFGEPGQADVDKAREAFRLQHDMNVSMRIAQNAGIGSDYFSQVANVDDIDYASKIGMADLDARAKSKARHPQTRLVEEVSRALTGQGESQRVREFFAAEQYQMSRREALLDAPATVREGFENALNELPVGAKAAGAVGAAGLALLAGAGGPDSVAGAEQYDMPSAGDVSGRRPSYHRGSEGSMRALQQMRSRSMRRASYANMRQPAMGGQQEPKRPPTISNYF